MKRNLWIVLCIIMLLLSLTGCSNKKKEAPPVEEKVQGSYKESAAQGPELEEGEVRFWLGKNRDNQLEYYTILYGSDTDCEVFCHTLVDGTWEKASVEWINQLTKDMEMYPCNMCHGEDGNDYLLILCMVANPESTKPEDNKISYSVVRNSEDFKSYLDVTPSYWRETKGTVDSVEGIATGRIDVTKDHKLIYKEDYQGNLVFYDLTKNEKVDIGDFDVASNYVLQGNTLYCLPYDSSVVRIHHLDDDTEEEIELNGISKESFLQVSQDGSVVILDEGGIHEYVNGGTMWETVLDGKQGSMSTPSYEPSCLVLIPGDYDTYYTIYNNNVNIGEELFVNYSFSENGSEDIVTNPESTPVPQKELTIYAMYDNTTLRQAISEYNKLHPEITFKYEVAMQGDDDVKRSDIIRTLNTEILAGNGADLFLMDGLPMESYIQKGILMDMSDVLMDSVQNQTFNNNIANNYVKDGSIYALPMRYYMPVYAMSKDITPYTKTVEDLATYCKDNDRRVMEELSYELLTQEFFYTYWNQIFTEDGLLDEERLTSFLSCMDIIAKQTGAQKEGDYGCRMGEGGVKGANDRMRETLCGGDFLLLLDDIDATITFIGDIPNMTELFACAKEAKGDYASINETFVPNGLIGINKSSKEAEAAKEFVAFLFSDEVQSLHLNDGYPINDNAMKSWMETPEGDDMTYGFSCSNEDGKEVELSYGSLTVEEKQSMQERIKTIHRPVYNDYVVMDMILEEAVNYLAGDKSLEEAVSDIMAKVNLYLKE